jgi:hypothetical protein
MSSSEIRAEIVPINPDFDVAEAVLRDREEINRRAHLVGLILWSDGERMPLDVFSYIREASRSFQYGCFLGAIALASCAVETIINHDSRTKPTEWRSLSPKTLEYAQARGLPVQVLLSPSETIGKGRPLFVDRRHKTAHGDIANIIATLSDYDPGAEAAALDQIKKASRFICEWFNTSPDVQQKRVTNHQWP